MNERQYQAAVGGLLHDIGKAVFRSGDGRSHPKSGTEFLQMAGVTDKEILDQVRFHHGKDLNGARLPQNSLAYVTYIADNIASAADRRKSHDEEEGSFDRSLPLRSIFNLLNGNDETKVYPPEYLSKKINLPDDNPHIKNDGAFYREHCDRIKDNLKGIQLKEQYVNSLLEVLEANLTYVPSSTNRKEEADISLFDHCKLTAAFGSAILEYLEEQRVSDYRKELFQQSASFYGKKAFLLYSIDLSGIQDFIYTIPSDGALKALRARSFYLELLMEHLVDTILLETGASRANCIYTGGGHSYLLLANTASVRRQIEQFEQDANAWLLKTFGTSLYLAGGYAECSADDLKNHPEGSYQEIFRRISTQISENKLHRYSAQQLIALNKEKQDGLRECPVCHRTDHLSDGEKCDVCEGLESFSKEIQTKGFFAVTKTRPDKTCLPLPGGAYLSAETAESLPRRMENDAGYLRSYAKNNFYTGQDIAAKLWVGDYQHGDDFHALAQAAEGTKKLAVLRADVDNLGQAFVSGFQHPEYENPEDRQRYVTLSRTATFSRKLSLFFKCHINEILENGEYFLTDKENGERSATIVYAGGDDVFVIGAWDDIVGFAVDLHDTLSLFAQDTLTISAGIGLYPEKYPVSAMARQTGELEELSKSHPGKNAVTLFAEGHTYSWDTFINHVLEEKYYLIRDFFSSTEEYGKSFLYKLLELMRNSEEKINLARYAYLLARMEPDEKASEQQRKRYQEFSRSMYEWMKDPEQRRQAVTAIYLYVYTIRDQDEKGANENGNMEF